MRWLQPLGFYVTSTLKLVTHISVRVTNKNPLTVQEAMLLRCFSVLFPLCPTIHVAPFAMESALCKTLKKAIQRQTSAIYGPKMPDWKILSMLLCAPFRMAFAILPFLDAASCMDLARSA